MANDVDVYRIARILIDEHGNFAEDEIEDKIKQYEEMNDFGAMKVWYEVGDALKEINELVH